MRKKKKNIFHRYANDGELNNERGDKKGSRKQRAETKNWFGKLNRKQKNQKQVGEKIFLCVFNKGLEEILRWKKTENRRKITI